MKSENDQETLDNMDELDGLLEDKDGEEELPPSNPRNAGRPKGSRNKNSKKEEAQEADSDVDVFQFARAWTQQKCEPVRVRIFRGGAFVADIDFSEDESKIKYNSLSDIQKVLGAGIYTFKVFSITTGTKIFETKYQILSLPPGLELGKENKEDDSLTTMLKNLGGDLDSNQNPTPAPAFNPTINIPRQRSLVEIVKELTPILAIIAPFVKDMIRPRGPDVYTMQKDLEEKLVRERQRMMDDQDRMDKKVKEMLEEKMQGAGLAPDKSTFEEIADVIKSVTGVLNERTKAQADVAKARIVSGRNRTLPGPKKLVVAPKKVETVAPVANKSLDDLKLAIIDIFEKVSAGHDEDFVNKYVSESTSLRSTILRHDKATISRTTKEVLKLDDETLQAIKPLLDKIYDNLQATS